MLTREQQFKALLVADDEFRGLMEGGIYTDEELGVEGFRRGETDPSDRNYSVTAAAFDENGNIRVCCLIREGGVMPYGPTQNPTKKISGTSQRVEILFYQHRNYNIINAARARSFLVLSGERLEDPGSYPLTWLADTPYFYDTGPVINSVTTKQDWMVFAMRQP